MKLRNFLTKRAGLAAVVAALLLLAASVVFAAGEEIILRRATEIALRDNPAARLAALRADRARVEAEQLRQRVDGAVYLLITTGTLPPAQMSLVYMGPLQAEQLEELAPHRKQAERNLLLLEVRRNYLELYRSFDRLKLAGQAERRAREQQRLAEVAFGAGTVARSDVMAAQVNVAATQARVFSAESEVQVARAALNKSLGRSLTAAIELPPGGFSLPEQETLDLDKGLAGAEAGRLEVISARETLRLKERELEYGRHMLDDAGRRGAELAVEEARLQLQMALEAVRLEVFQLYHRLAGLEKQLNVLEQGVGAASDAHRLAVLRYQAGVGTQFEITVAEDALVERELDLLHARYEGYLGYLSWRLATGQSLE
ncbi:MAG: TolC family protein [Dethiobacter sp.]|jgi:outer membrane protein TolC|nr:TolC family protein [Dethiobacter sp.]MBS3901477.1 TolC family protein [Dethiobacter sp.]